MKVINSLSNKNLIVPERDISKLHVMNARVYDEDEAHKQVEDISIKIVCDSIDSLLLYS